MPNRTLALDRIDQALVRSARTGTAVAVIAMDVDDFGSVNDSLGQQAGDELLTELATGLASLVPAGETLARSGGDEFAVVSEGLAHEDDAAVLVETLLSVAANGPGWGRHHVHPTLSAGLTLATETGTTAADLLSRADIALSRAKRDRPGTYRIFDEGMRGEAMGRFNVAGELRHALRTGGLHLAYQPIVSLRTGEVVAVEALARWTTEQGEQVPPDVFVPIAEETGLIGELGLTVLREACRHAVCWQEIAPVGIRVNVSGRELQLATYAHTVAGVLEETGLSPHVLGLEITESVLLSEGGTTQGTVADLHQAGITLLIDDFGTGFSSLSYLQRFPDADVLKIDRSFVGLDPRGEAVVRAVVGLGQAFGLTTCAEGTETAEQLHRMRELGCDYAQGYHLARPMPAAELEALLRAPGRPEGA